RAVSAMIGLNTTEKYTSVCLDTGCSATIINTDLARSLGTEIHHTEAPLNVSGIGSRHQATEYTMFKVYIPRQLHEDRLVQSYGHPSYAAVTIKAYLVENLRPNLLIGTDTIGREGIILDYKRQTTSIRGCQNFVFPI
ncbi:retropepsin-like aspartic protease, partial [Aspergillus saccharolyticus JOP 1030-1]